MAVFHRYRRNGSKTRKQVGINGKGHQRDVGDFGGSKKIAPKMVRSMANEGHGAYA